MEIIMKTLTYKTHGTCSREITVVTEEDKVVSVRFLGGCNGNTQGVAALVSGMNIDEAISKLKGINCNGKGTSCPDQLSKALEQIKELNEQ